ncbi:MAG: GNAT family protein [Paracoccaceae bacterium]|uniref:GNAT family N-acetyltransferase n=1 Tax=Nonlabens ulvanivorans TaxID=906888 RepID=UPI00326FAD58
MTQHNRPTLQGLRVVLRAPCADDVAARFALGNTPEIQAMFGADPSQVRPITQHAAEAWVQNQINETHSWIIEVDDHLIGSVRLHSVNHADQRANIAIGILDPNALGKGYGTEAMQLLAHHAFDTLGLHRLTCRVLAFNDRATAAYEKVGFVVEGRERESALIGKTRHDDLIMGLLSSDLEARS